MRTSRPTSSTPGSLTSRRWLRTSTTASSTSRPTSVRSRAGSLPSTRTTATGPRRSCTSLTTPTPRRWWLTASFTPLLEGIRSRLPKVRRWYVVSDETGDGPDWAVSYESVVAKGADRTIGSWGRSGKDLLLLYTGGTTGMPKGVMWEQDDLFNVLGAGGQPLLGLAPIASAADAGEQLLARASAGGCAASGDDVGMPAHARHRAVLVADHDEPRWVGRDVARPQVRRGRAVAHLPRPARELAHHRRRHVARPMVQALDANPGKWDLSSLNLHLLVRRDVEPRGEGPAARAHPERDAVRLVAGRVKPSAWARRSPRRVPRARPPPSCSAGKQHGVHRRRPPRRAPAATSTVLVAVSGFLPAGYYKDQAKSDSDVQDVRGQAVVHPRRLGAGQPRWHAAPAGRGSVYEHGRQKVFPEEVEEVLETTRPSADAPRMHGGSPTSDSARRSALWSSRRRRPVTSMGTT